MLTRTESLPWHSPPTAVASYLGDKQEEGQFGHEVGKGVGSDRILSLKL